MGKKYVRVRTKYKKSFYGIVKSKGKGTTLYLLVDKEGDDKSYKDKQGNYAIPHLLLSDSLIVSEKPMIVSLLYGWLVPDTIANRKQNREVIRTSRR